MPNQNESLNVSAKTVDEAIEQGLNQLGLTRDQVDVEIINEGKRSLFGLKSEEAVVQLTPRGQAIPDSEPEPAAEEFPLLEPDGSISPEAGEAVPTAADETTHTPPIESFDRQAQPPEVDDLDQEVAKIGAEYLTGLLKQMGIKAEVTTRIASDLVEPGEEPPLVLDVTGKDLGILIGRRNETLQALQYMVRLMVSKKMGSWQRIVVDVESYRSRRRRSLHQMAKRMADRAITNNERVVLEAMPAYERRLIHIALRDHPDVFTKSIGRDKNRKVTIIPK